MEKTTLKLWQALIPIVILIGMLAYNVYVYQGDALGGSNQFVLLLGAAVAAIVGFAHKIPYKKMIKGVAKNLESTSGAILILLMVGSLAGTWLISGIIPAMIYYGLQLLNPSVFLPAAVLISSFISIATGSSWTTSATIGIAFMGIGEALGFPVGMVAGAVISGAYFGDKMSPMSDTTNLAPAMAGTDLFTHIRYMTITTLPTYIITLIVFILMGLNHQINGDANVSEITLAIKETFEINIWLFLVPVAVVALILMKTEPLIALLFGTLAGALFAFLYQMPLLLEISGLERLDFQSIYRVLMDAITVETVIKTDNLILQDLFVAKGMAGMLPTIWLIICAMVFGGVMEAIGALAKISDSLLKLATSIFGLFASTVASCITLNFTASDQYLAIVVPGRMFAKAYKDKGLAPENLSRTLEDSGTVTSVLIPWNTCGAYQSGVLGVDTLSYIPYAVFNYLSPITTLVVAGIRFKIKMIKDTK
ncbi:MAG: sodium:proton antiporter [Bacteroidales bacterium]|nr:sodium:proton antiporter [Bacteroidales bacterium]